MKRWNEYSPGAQLVLSLGAASVVSVCFWATGAIAEGRYHEGYLIWNLFLAWLPLLFATLLVRLLRMKAWSSWSGLGLTFLWLVFLPNSFYMVSDFIHITEVPSDALLYNSLMFASFIFCGTIVGFLSLHMVHTELRKRLPRRQTLTVLAVVLLACSFAIYLGRNLRWNSWDILVNPAGLLFDVSDRVLHPQSHPQTFAITFSFFVFLVTFYAVTLCAVRAIHGSNSRHMRYSQHKRDLL